MPQSGAFTGFTADGYRFLMELEFNNEKSFVDANRQRYYDGIRNPMRALATELSPAALDIDPLFNTALTGVISRLNRDTRFSANKLPYRTHAWLSFRHKGKSVGEGFGLYFEVQPSGYGYGMGIYSPNTELMAQFRARIQAKPTAFLKYAKAAENAGMHLEGDMFKRDRYKDADERLKPYLNRKSLGWTFFCPSVKRTMQPELKDDVLEAFAVMKPLYRLLCGLD